MTSIEEKLERKIFPPGSLSELFPYNVLTARRKDIPNVKNMIKNRLQNGMEFRETINHETGEKTWKCIDSGDIHKKVEESIGVKFKRRDDGEIELKEDLPPIFYEKIAKNLIVLTGPIFEPTYGITGKRINIVGDGEKAWIKEIEQQLNKVSYTLNQKRYIEAALIELKQTLDRKRPRGQSQKLSKDSQIKKDAPLLYYWLKSEIMDKNIRFPLIEDELTRLRIKPAFWKSAKTLKILTFELIKKTYGLTEWQTPPESFWENYVQRVFSEKEAREFLNDSSKIWATLANKFLYCKQILWCLCYDNSAREHAEEPYGLLVVKEPRALKVMNERPMQLACDFDIYDEQACKFESRRLVYKEAERVARGKNALDYRPKRWFDWQDT